MAERKICVVTGTRADYGLLYWLMKEIDADPALCLQLIVTGAHLEPRFSHTVDVIEADGFTIDARVPIDLSDDSAVGIATSMGLALSGIAKAITDLKPDIVVVLGDRFEILSAAEAAMLCRIPIAHIHGGEATEGLIDEPIRHAITKMSQLHFATAEPYRRRIIQMGEQPDSVFTVGAPGLDNIARLTLLDREALGANLNLSLEQGYFLVTYHPVTLSGDDPGEAVTNLIKALDLFPEKKIILTGVNADPGNSEIDRLFSSYARNNSARVHSAVSLGQIRYLSAMKHADVIVGNSSSGLIEAPAFGVPTVNIGERQRGRLKADSVIDCASNEAAIADALTKALSPSHRKIAASAANPYGTPGASASIKGTLRDAQLHEGVLMKRFFDMAVPA